MPCERVLTSPYISKNHLYLPPKCSWVQRMHTPLAVQGGLNLMKEPGKGRGPKCMCKERPQTLLPKGGRWKAPCQEENGQQGTPAAVHILWHCLSPPSLLLCYLVRLMTHRVTQSGFCFATGLTDLLLEVPPRPAVIKTSELPPALCWTRAGNIIHSQAWYSFVFFHYFSGYLTNWY